MIGATFEGQPPTRWHDKVNPIGLIQRLRRLNSSRNAFIHETETVELNLIHQNVVPISISHLATDDEKGPTFFLDDRGAQARILSSNRSVVLRVKLLNLHVEASVLGYVNRLDAVESDTSYSRTNRDEQLAAWDLIGLEPGRDHSQAADFNTYFEGQEIPRPYHWMGYRLLPGSRFELLNC